MEKGCIIYCHSTQGEVERLRAIADGHGWTVRAVYKEDVATPPSGRVGLAAVRRVLAEDGVAALLVPSLLLLGRSLPETVGFIAKLAALDVELIALDDRIDSTTADGKARMSGIAALDGFQQALRQRSARAGQLRAMGAGIRMGRKPISASIIESVRIALAQGHGVRPTARRMGLSAGRVSAEKQAMRVAGHIP